MYDLKRTLEQRCDNAINFRIFATRSNAVPNLEVLLLQNTDRVCRNTIETRIQFIKQGFPSITEAILSGNEYRTLVESYSFSELFTAFYVLWVNELNFLSGRNYVTNDQEYQNMKSVLENVAFIILRLPIFDENEDYRKELELIRASLDTFQKLIRMQIDNYDKKVDEKLLQIEKVHS